MYKIIIKLLVSFSLLFPSLDFPSIYNAPPEWLMDCPGIDELPLENTVWTEEFCDWIVKKKTDYCSADCLGDSTEKFNF